MGLGLAATDPQATQFLHLKYTNFKFYWSQYSSASIPPVWRSWSKGASSQLVAMAEWSGCQERLLVLSFYFPSATSSKWSSFPAS